MNCTCIIVCAVIICITIILLILFNGSIFHIKEHKQEQKKESGGSVQDFWKQGGGTLTVSTTDFSTALKCNVRKWCHFKSGMLSASNPISRAPENPEMSSKDKIVSLFRDFGDNNTLDADNETEWWSIKCNDYIGLREYILNSVLCKLLGKIFNNVYNYSDAGMERLFRINTSDLTKNAVAKDASNLNLDIWGYSKIGEHYMCLIGNVNEYTKYRNVKDNLVIILDKIRKLNIDTIAQNVYEKTEFESKKEKREYLQTKYKYLQEKHVDPIVKELSSIYVL